MQAALPTPRTGFKFTISVLQGPDKGATYQLLPPRVTLGRAPESNIVLKDPKISRNAAVIEFSPEQILITDLSGRDALHVNGQQVSKASLKDGDSILLGESEFSFLVEALMLAPLGPVPPPGFNMARPRPAQNTNSRVPFYATIIVIGGMAAYLMSSTPKLKKEGNILRTTAAVEKDIQSSTDRADEIVKKRTFANDEERTRFEEAQKHYLEGFRDYSKSQWMRAMRSFETALAIDPENQLARRYYKLAEKQRDEEISLLSLEGRRYKDKHMFARCTSAFEKVMEAITNKDDAKFKEADALRKECQLLEEERFQ